MEESGDKGESGARGGTWCKGEGSGDVEPPVHPHRLYGSMK